MAEIHQVLVRLLDGKHKALNFTTPSISGESVKQRIREITSIPIHHQILLSNGHHLLDHQALASNGPPATVHLLLRLRGGKGGFGSLLRGAATKAGQKKTNNFDACRDMSGRRLRHVNAEKKLEEWMAEAEERKLEKIAEEYIKKKSKAVKKGGPSGETEKYVEKYRKDSAKCMEEVERTVRESFKGFVNSKKRGVEAKRSEAKRLKIWLGKRKSGDSDSDDSDIDDSSDDDNEEETEKSVIDNNENNPDSNNGTDGSSGSVTGGKADVVSSGSGSDLEETVLGEEREGEEPSLKMNEENSVGSCLGDGVTLVNDEAVEKRVEESSENGCLNKEEVVVVALPLGVSSSGEGEEKISVTVQPVVCQEEAVSTSEGVLAVEKPLNFDEFSSAAEMEVLGMERLKSELQGRGLKCGGTLQERAARLFLLKTTPLEKLPKKLLAKK